MKYHVMAYGSWGLIGIAFLIKCFVFPQCKPGMNSCPSKMDTVFFYLGFLLLITAMLSMLVSYCREFTSIKGQLQDLNDSESGQQAIVWRLDGEEWIHYLNYIHGPNRQWCQMASLSSFCCRRSSYDRLKNRQYGHIVLYGNGLIIDELYPISFRTYSLRGVEILNVVEQQGVPGLRIHTYFKAGKFSENYHFDVFAPSSVPMEHLIFIAQWYNETIHR